MPEFGSVFLSSFDYSIILVIGTAIAIVFSRFEVYFKDRTKWRASSLDGIR